ncbi:MAG TPA: hypothetical protein VG759_22190 [Candidatus Angelobacter sp.]|jgi:hypothetical protein|nr:hypothetical protein [Candidatus Angelobacter sp.]
MNLSELERLTKENKPGSTGSATAGTDLTATNLTGTIGGTIGGTNLTSTSDQLQADIKLKTSL